jgi:hypothetical protein
MDFGQILDAGNPEQLGAVADVSIGKQYHGSHVLQ